MTRTRISKRAKVLIAGTTVLFILLTIAGWWLGGEVALSITLGILAISILFCCLETLRRTHHLSLDLESQYRQVESLLSLFFTLRPSAPLPDTRGWAASPDLLKKIAEVVLRTKPNLVVEASCGVSTLIIASCLKQLGRGKVISLEHDPEYAAISREVVSLHGLEEIATIVNAPLREIELHNDKWLWYDTRCLRIDEPIDLLVIDGPPRDGRRLVRYPSLPLLFKHLGAEAIIILDDGNREEERRIIELWSEEFSQITHEFLPLEKGAFVIHKHLRRKSA